MKLRTIGAALALVAALGGCGLKGPLYLPEKSDVTIRQAPAKSVPATPGEQPPATPQAAPETPASPGEQEPQQPPAPPTAPPGD
jgi:predicted small lipoprotein YifL